MSSLLIKNGIIVNPTKGAPHKGDIYIKAGRICQMGTSLTVPHEEDVEVIDAEGLYVTPGLVDMHTHMRVPGQEYKEGLVSGTKAALAGGFTSIATMANTNPVIDRPEVVRQVQQQIADEALMKVYIIGAISKGLQGKELSEMAQMAEAGVVAFSDDGHYVEQAQIMRRAMEYASELDMMVIDHAEDMTMAGRGHMNEGVVSFDLAIPGRPPMAEDIAVSRDIILAKETGAHIHIAHMSSKGAVDLVRQGKANGVHVTSEATAQHLTFTDEILRSYEPAGKMAPPIRSEDHRKALLEGLRDGTVDAIITDHAPHTSHEKDHFFCCTPNGFTGLETSLSAVITRAYKTGYIDMNRLVELMSVNPARLLGIPGGVLDVGVLADITIFDDHTQWVVDRNAFYTKGTVNPFHGMTLTGKVHMTIVDGTIMMRDGIVVE